MSDKLSDARKSLVRAKQTAQARLQQLDEEKKQTKSSIKSLDAAIRALDGPKKTKAATSVQDELTGD